MLGGVGKYEYGNKASQTWWMVGLSEERISCPDRIIISKLPFIGCCSVIICSTERGGDFSGSAPDVAGGRVRDFRYYTES